MQFGFVGLGKMGFNMVERLLEKKHDVAVFDRNAEQAAALVKQGALSAASLEQLVSSLAPPRLVWLMVPFQAVDAVLRDLMPRLSPGDTVIDGGNSPYKYSVRRAEELARQGVSFLDAGVSGGPAGARSGSCIMVGGRSEIFRRYEQLFRDLAAEHGYAHVGKAGAGHFVKMIHNGIEYGMMQALAEGFALLKSAPFELDLVGISELYNHRSVIESRLLEWLRLAYERYGSDLESISGSAGQSGEGMWTVEAARELGISVPVIQAALDFRLRSQKNPSYTGKVISALRHQFGGHEVMEEAQKPGGSRAP